MFFLFDIGGTNMRLGVSDDGQNITASKIVPTPEDFEQGIQTVKQVADELSNGAKIKGVAGGIAVVFDKDKSIPISTSHLHGWVNKPLKEALVTHFQAPVFIDNDCVLVGLGEATSGAGVGVEIVAYITISTGVGGARIVNRKVDKTSLGFEPGHQVIVIDGNSCHCGGKGHFETYVGGWYLQRDYQKPAEEITDPKIWDDVTRYLAVGLTNTIVHWSPDVVVLGGAVMKSIQLEKLRTYLKDYLTIFPNQPMLVAAKLGNDAGLYGALELLKEY